MMKRRLRFLNRSQWGFTVIELIAVVAITGLIGVGTTTTIFQVLTQGNRNTEYMTASRHSLNAAYWISHDALMSQTVTPSGDSGFPLTLAWVDWDNVSHQVTYTLEDGQLRRSLVIGEGAPSEFLVAAYIDPNDELTCCTFAGGVLTLKITAAVGKGSGAASVTQTRGISPRPGL